MAVCKSCGATIIWIDTVNGKKMPCDADQKPYWEHPEGKVLITPSGETVKGTLAPQRMPAAGVGYVPHWVTCPQASLFRKKKERAERGKE